MTQYMYVAYSGIISMQAVNRLKPRTISVTLLSKIYKPAWFAALYIFQFRCDYLLPAYLP